MQKQPSCPWGQPHKLAPFMHVNRVRNSRYTYRLSYVMVGSENSRTRDVGTSPIAGSLRVNKMVGTTKTTGCWLTSLLSFPKHHMIFLLARADDRDRTAVECVLGTELLVIAGYPLRVCVCMYPCVCYVCVCVCVCGWVGVGRHTCACVRGGATCACARAMCGSVGVTAHR